MFPRAAITNCHSLGGFKQQKCIVSWFWGLEVWNRGVGRPVSSEGLGFAIRQALHFQRVTPFYPHHSPINAKVLLACLFRQEGTMAQKELIIQLECGSIWFGARPSDSKPILYSSCQTASEMILSLLLGVRPCPCP